MQKERVMATSSAVQVQYQTGCTFNATTATIQISNGSIQVGANTVQLNGTFNFSTFVVASTQIVFDNNSPSATVSGMVSIPVVPNGQDPSITVSNFTGQAQVNWTVDGNPKYAPLSPGDPVVLSGLYQS